MGVECEHSLYYVCIITLMLEQAMKWISVCVAIGWNLVATTAIAQEEAASEAAAPAAEAAEAAAPLPYDFHDPGIFARVEAERGIPFAKDYDMAGCTKVDKNDHCLPTSYVRAVEEGEPWESLWKAELAIREAGDMQAYQMLKTLDRKFPNNHQVYWLLAKNLFFRAEKMEEGEVDAKDLVLSEGIEWAEKCIALKPNDINCQLHYGTLVGRWSTNKGIFKALFNGKVVEKAWLAAVASKEHYRFPSSNTSVGATYYGLGIFYRLVPDSWFLSLIAGVRGSIDKAMKYLKLARQTKQNQIELYTELAAAHYCKWDRDDDDAAKAQGDGYVKTCQRLPVPDEINGISQKDCGRLKKDPSMGCGYSRDRQQETDVDKYKEEQGS